MIFCTSVPLSVEPRGLFAPRSAGPRCASASAKTLIRFFRISATQKLQICTSVEPRPAPAPPPESKSTNNLAHPLAALDSGGARGDAGQAPERHARSWAGTFTAEPQPRAAIPQPFKHHASGRQRDSCLMVHGINDVAWVRDVT